MSNTYKDGASATIWQGKDYEIDVDKIQTLEDLKYLFFALAGLRRDYKIYLNETSDWFNELKHLIKNEEPVGNENECMS